MYDPSGPGVLMTPEQKKRKKWPWVLGAAVVVVLVLCGIGTIVAFAVDDAAKEANKAVSDTATATPAKKPVQATPTTAEPEYLNLRASDIDASVKVTSRECYGSIGCDIEYKVVIAVDKSKMKSGKSYDVTYEVNGGKDGPLVGTLTLNDDGTYSQDGYQSTMTTSSKKKLTVKVTEVEENL